MSAANARKPPEALTPMLRRSILLPALVLGLLLAGTAPPAAAGGDQAGDADRDGRDDLVVGIPDEDVGPAVDAGSVAILPGSPGGPSPARDRIVTQSTLGGNLESLDRFGNAVAYGDFDADGFDDVAIGAPTEDFGGVDDTGVVHILYGTPSGLSTTRVAVFSQAEVVGATNQRGDFFGATVASGDFNADNYADLAVGMPGQDFGTNIAAGAVVVFFGGSGGLRSAGAQVLDQGPGLPSRPGRFDGFGAALAAGDHDGDGRDDLAIGVPGETIGRNQATGIVHVVYGSRGGIGPANIVYTERGSLPGKLADNDLFGSALAFGDVDVDGDDELAIAVPGQEIAGRDDAGMVIVVDGQARTVTTLTARAFSKKGQVPGKPRIAAEFGAALAMGDFNGDGDDDLAVGTPGDLVAGRAKAGSVTVLGGGSSGLRPDRAIFFAQGFGAPGNLEAGDRFGLALRAGNFNGDAFTDLAVGVPYEDVGSVGNAGGVVVMAGGPGSLTLAGSVELTQDTAGVADVAQIGDRFGLGL